MNTLEWYMSYHYFRYEGLLYKRETSDIGTPPSWYRVTPDEVETMINAEPMESIYQEWLKRGIE